MRAIEEAQPLRLACAAIMVPSARRGLFGAAFSSAANSPYHRIASDREYPSALHHRSRSAVSCERMRNERTGDCLLGACRVFFVLRLASSCTRITEKTGPRRIPLFSYYEIHGGG